MFRTLQDTCSILSVLFQIYHNSENTMHIFLNLTYPNMGLLKL